MGRDVGERDDIDASGHAGHAHGLADELVLDVGGTVDDLRPRVADPHVALEAGCQHDVDPLVDARRDHGAAVLVVEVGQIRTATDEADPQWRSRNDHLSATDLIVVLVHNRYGIRRRIVCRDEGTRRYPWPGAIDRFTRDEHGERR